MRGNRCVIFFFLPTSIDPILHCAGRKRRAEQELGQWVSIACWKSGDLGSFPYSPMDILSEILCLSLLLCKRWIFTCKDAFRTGSGEPVLRQTGNVSAGLLKLKVTQALCSCQHCSCPFLLSVSFPVFFFSSFHCRRKKTHKKQQHCF